MRRGGKADLVVDHNMHGAAGLVATSPTGQSIRQQRPALQRPHRRAAGSAEPASGRIAQLFLFGADLAQNHRIHRLKVDGFAVSDRCTYCRQIPGRRGAQMVFHIARAVDIVGFKAAALKFVENRADRVCPSHWPEPKDGRGGACR